MDFQGLCEFAFEEVNGQPQEFYTVSLDEIEDPLERRTVRAVKKAYLDILQFSRQWRFLNVRGALLSLIANQGEYDESEFTVSNLRNIEWDSLYLTKAGSTARWAIQQESYDCWQAREKTGPTSTGIPDVMVASQDPEKWLFWPVPNAVYVLNGNGVTKPVQFSALDDLPTWAERNFDEMIAWKAVMMIEGRRQTQDEAVTSANMRTAQSNFSGMWQDFCVQYLPTIRGPDPQV